MKRKIFDESVKDSLLEMSVKDFMNHLAEMQMKAEKEQYWCYNFIPDYQFGKTFAKIMNVIESIGLTDKQEKGIRGQLRDILFEMTDDVASVSNSVISELNRAGFPSSTFIYTDSHIDKSILEE
jgi:hypothetical protein